MLPAPLDPQEFVTFGTALYQQFEREPTREEIKKSWAALFGVNEYDEVRLLLDLRSEHSHVRAGVELAKSNRTIKNPGIRGGKFYISDSGAVIYGQRPQGGHVRGTHVLAAAAAASVLGLLIAHYLREKDPDEVIAQAQSDIQAAGYPISEIGLFSQTPPEHRARAYAGVACAIKMVHKEFPHVADYMRQSGLKIEMDVSGEDATPGAEVEHGLYNWQTNTIRVGRTYKDTFYHEYMHALDQALRSKPYVRATETPHHPFRAMAQDLKGSASHSDLVNEAETRKRQRYLDQRREIAARAFQIYMMDRSLGDRWRYANDPHRDLEKYSRADIAEIGRYLHAALDHVGEHPTQKSFSGHDGEPDHPGSRGGIGFWNDHGHWQYGLRSLSERVRALPRTWEVPSAHPTPAWDDSSLDRTIKDFLAQRGVLPAHEADALMHLGQTARDDLASHVYMTLGVSEPLAQNAVEKHLTNRVIALREGLRQNPCAPTPAEDGPALPPDYRLVGHIKVGPTARRPADRFDIQTVLIHWDYLSPEQQQQWGNWYEDEAVAEATKMHQAYPQYSVAKCAAVLAAVSPEMVWDKRDPTAEEDEEGQGDERTDNKSVAWAIVRGETPKIKNPGNVKKAQAILRLRREPTVEDLGGDSAPKIKSFWLNIMGLHNAETATIDRHMANLLGVRRYLITGTKVTDKSSIPANEYAYWNHVMVEAGRVLGVEPRRIQAATWQWYRLHQMGLRSATNKIRGDMTNEAWQEYYPLHPEAQEHAMIDAAFRAEERRRSDERIARKARQEELGIPEERRIGLGYRIATWGHRTGRTGSGRRKERSAADIVQQFQADLDSDMGIPSGLLPYLSKLRPSEVAMVSKTLPSVRGTGSPERKVSFPGHAVILGETNGYYLVLRDLTKLPAKAYPLAFGQQELFPDQELDKSLYTRPSLAGRGAYAVYHKDHSGHWTCTSVVGYDQKTGEATVAGRTPGYMGRASEFAHDVHSGAHAASFRGDHHTERWLPVQVPSSGTINAGAWSLFSHLKGTPYDPFDHGKIDTYARRPHI